MGEDADDTGVHADCEPELLDGWMRGGEVNLPDWCEIEDEGSESTSSLDVGGWVLVWLRIFDIKVAGTIWSVHAD